MILSCWCYCYVSTILLWQYWLMNISFFVSDIRNFIVRMLKFWMDEIVTKGWHHSEQWSREHPSALMQKLRTSLIAPPGVMDHGVYVAFIPHAMFGDMMAWWCLDISFDGMMFGNTSWWHGVWRQLSQMSLMSGVDTMKCLGFFWGSFIEILLLPGVGSNESPKTE